MVNNASELIVELRNQGERMTAVRFDSLELFMNSSTPITAGELKTFLKQQGLPVNKTTVYRELAFLTNKGIIKEVEFGDGKTRYEMATREHHHHFICNKCGSVTDIEMDKDVDRLVGKAAAKGYEVTDHFLEFFGMCPKCSNNQKVK